MPKSSIKLPIYTVIPDLIAALAIRHEAVLEAPPGAGKTTVVPLELLHQPWLKQNKIIMLEPRRLAARAAAERMASTLGEAVGQTVGYRVRMDTKISHKTRIEVVTEGILTRMLQQDPSLEGVGLVIFDEFHERSLDADLGLALILQGRTLFREDEPLKILMMSATLDSHAIAELLDNAPVISSKGRSFPVELIYSTPWKSKEWVEPRVVSAIKTALSAQTGSLLVFLPGQAEIRRVETQLYANLNEFDKQTLLITPLYGDLSLEQQRKAIAPAPAEHRKIVLTTAIAETSLTIEGVDVVIDSGLSRQANYDPNTGMTRLHTRRLSRAASTQRAGRAGRMAPGTCYRLWSLEQQAQLAPFTLPEIQKADLTPLILQLYRWGCNDPSELAWLDPPAAAPSQQARELLVQLNALQLTASGYRLTEQGEQMARLPVHPRLAHMMLQGRRYQLGYLACELAALLSERDPLQTRQADIQQRLDWLQGKKACHASQQGQLYRLKQQCQRFYAMCQQLPIETTLATIEANDRIGFLIASAWPDRVAQQKGPQRFLLANGRASHLNDNDYLSKTPWLAIAQLGGHEGKSSDAIWLAAPFNTALFNGPLSSMLHTRQRVEWNDQQQKLIAEEQQCCGELIIQSKPLSKLSDEARIEALVGLVRIKGLSIFSHPQALNQWRQRVNFLHNTFSNNTGLPSGSENPWPDLSDAALLATLEVWLTPYLSKVSRLNHFAQLNLHSILLALLPWPLPQKLDELAPERLTVPSGSKIRIDYSESPPILGVKLQEMFGGTSTPTIANDVKLKIHLLSPAGHPLQVTQDLENFWQQIYPQVKKEMKGRYPKHPWPDDPWSAIATHKTKRHLS
ncbi:ATP-dependent helicase HrpB [Neptunomonas antarctica]|uniref:ATP-dependent helicase HrpB n=1 Tax=Neptunomonas antarctica TaxID=619304 RepID=A0A1N7KKN7_9GAMM|nr:ATP-dependent helicase HrpB [Neptunomonas antarctica]SIS62181.1 ATP-dependent helicase HrpB [Neptunomonas antarctica]